MPNIQNAHSEELPQRVTLVIPPSVFLIDQRVFMSLGILRIASMLESAGIAVELVDLSGVENYLDALRDHLKVSAAKFVGITVTTPQLPHVVTIVDEIRRVRPDIRVILGGPHITLTASAVKLEKKALRIGRAHLALKYLQTLADVLVAGDGEFAIFDALRPEAPFLVDGDDPKAGLFMTNAMYEEAPYPARELIDVKSYNYEIEGFNATSVIAQLGCPFNCGFCGGRNSKSLRQIRTRSSLSVIDEVKMLHQSYGFTAFMFYDDELNVNKKMIELMDGLTNLQMALGVEFRFRGFVKSELFTLDQAKAMRRAGFRWLLSGFESGAPRILENINKRATLADNNRTMDIAREAGLKVKALMSVGHPGESFDTISDTQAWLLAVQPDDFDCTIITTYPGTPYYDEAIPHPTLPGVFTYRQPKTGDLLHAVDVDFRFTMDYYKGDPKGGYKSFVFTDFITQDQLVERRSWVENSVRESLKIPFPVAQTAIRYEHSTGQGMNALPDRILRVSSPLDRAA